MCEMTNWTYLRGHGPSPLCMSALASLPVARGISSSGRGCCERWPEGKASAMRDHRRSGCPIVERFRSEESKEETTLPRNRQRRRKIQGRRPADAEEAGPETRCVMTIDPLSVSRHGRGV
ncbi:hypothetical protein L227DRAFT_181245 [Lentinus tigrinus ALCF2SS1-6]|uniref:Uncharacterized protein n=1 Tax=Lentinus tigrinus ALCF2SS1-6 TaxID=1328759 RepID=A0A5C2S5U7_9APHY|nr:hypothetical protein L227DRAFT_181245 [Lentinus tigrinus ALCF2SS1-6]